MVYGSEQGSTHGIKFRKRPVEYARSRRSMKELKLPQRFVAWHAAWRVADPPLEDPS